MWQLMKICKELFPAMFFYTILCIINATSRAAAREEIIEKS